MSPREWLQRERLIYAQSLMTESDLKLAEIAALAAFATSIISVASSNARSAYRLPHGGEANWVEAAALDVGLAEISFRKAVIVTVSPSQTAGEAADPLSRT